MPPDAVLLDLAKSYELHNCRLAPHAVDEAARQWVVGRDAVRKRLMTYFDRRETGWSLELVLPAALRPDIVEAPDALAAYERLAANGEAPPTYRLFRSVFIESRAFPQFHALAERDRVVWSIAAMGQGRRACSACSEVIRR